MAGNMFAAAFAKKAKEIEAMTGVEVMAPEVGDRWETDPKRVPMMYRAQVQGRCSLHNAKRENQDLDNWAGQWTFPQKNGEARYQRSMPVLGQDGDIYRVAVAFPFRLFSNGGQDSIMRPMMGKDGIPFLPGSSVKGSFLRACSAEQVSYYCGRTVRKEGKMQHLPGEVPLRFLGAYPVGNWANRLVDLVHPQGNRQVGTGAMEERSTALALVSLYQPRMVFEFSGGSEVNWAEVRAVWMAALMLGVGGKTSSGYGLGGGLVGQPAVSPKTRVMVLMSGVGVSSVLRDGVTPEFRTNLFKAGLRGHLRRLLGGVDEGKADEVVNRWFGGKVWEMVDGRQQKVSKAARVKLLWQEREMVRFEDVGMKNRNPSYRVSGLLYADIDRGATIASRSGEAQAALDGALLEQLIMFGYVMGGWGKSWRRVWHGLFLPDYHKSKFAIGCHWSSSDLDEVQSAGQLKGFLDGLSRQCCEYLGVRTAKSASWREAWSVERVAVFARVGTSSGAIGLFHQEEFKTTPAIGGRSPGDKRPTGISSVWHRMLPLKNGTEFLEIVTVFYGDRRPWVREGVDQLPLFVQALQEGGLKLTWGTMPGAGMQKKRVVART